MDAPLQWWKCFTAFLVGIGLKQSELDPCCFYYFHERVLHGVIALHVDDMVLGGSDVFLESIVRRMREKFPFKHWITKQGEFLGRQLCQIDDYSIVTDQKACAKRVKTIQVSKDRRKKKINLLMKKRDNS